MRRYRAYLAPLLAGLTIAIAVLHTVSWLAWVCMVPLFVGIDGAKPGKAARMGCITGLTLSVFGFYWMIPGARTFTGASIWYGVAVFVICSIAFSAYWGCLLYIFAWLKPRVGRRMGALSAGALLAAGLWVCAEAGLGYLAQGMPWFLFHMGNALADNLYAIQPFSIGGVHAGTFVVVAINYWISQCIVRKRWTRLLWPVVAITAYLGLGWALLYEPRGPAAGPQERAGFRLSILSENIAPDMAWDSANGNELVARLLNLDRRAAVIKPDMTLWSESAIPWTYRDDDDLVREIKRIAPLTHILGMNTAYAPGVVYNSAYCLRPDGSVAGRYDKHTLLLGIEQPWNGWLIPFFSAGGYAVKSGDRDGPRPTPFGPAGMLICNESAVPEAAARQARDGARFLLNLSNDGWFADTYLVPLHFYNARLRAVETRKDIAINSNDGLSGMISASGRIETEQQDDDPRVCTVTIQPNDDLTPAARYPWLPAAVCLLLCLLLPYYKQPN